MANAIPKTSILNDQWALEFKELCSCGRGTTPLFYCNVESCPEHEQILFCTDCVMIDNKHNHGRVQVKLELEKRMEDWKEVVHNMKALKQIIDNNYSKHQPLIKYLDNENLLKVDMAVKAPSHNVSDDVDKLFEEVAKIN